MSATADRDLLDRARREVDLPGFLTAKGWTIGANDTKQWRRLDGPDGQRLLLHRSKTGDWLWQDANDRTAKGNIYHLVKHLDRCTHGQAMAAIRRAVASPPPVLDFRRGDHTSTATHEEPRPPRSLHLLGERGRSYLTEARHLDPATLDAFAHAIREDDQGRVVFPHNRYGDGEVKSADQPSRFHGSREDGEGRGRSLHLAVPYASQETPTHLIVTESGIDAYSGWEMLPADLQPRTAIASTGGGISEAGRNKLERALLHMVAQHGHGVPVLADASDVGEQSTEARTAWLRELAERVGVQYHRVVPLHQVKDWNEELAAVKAAAQEAQEAQEAAQEAAQAAETMAACYPASDAPDEPGEAQSRSQGRGPSR